MAEPLFGVDNILSTGQYVNHILTAEENAADLPNLTDGRRSGISLWASTTASSDTWFKVQCDLPRGVDFIAIDRGSNLLGDVLKVEVSDDDFTTSREVFNETLPTETAPGSVDDVRGVVTEEGVWLKRWPVDVGYYWRVTIPDQGAGIVAQVVGCWLGKSWQPSYFTNPLEDSTRDFVVAELESDSGWLGRGPGSRRRRGTITYKEREHRDEDAVRYHIEGLFGAGQLMWILHDADQAERAVLAGMRAGSIGFGYSDPNWAWRAGTVPWMEWEHQT